MCVAVRQGAELEESRSQAVLLSSENGIIADKRQPQLLKSTYFIHRKTVTSHALGLAWAVPPESERRACDHRGSSGTWEVQCTP